MLKGIWNFDTGLVSLTFGLLQGRFLLIAFSLCMDQCLCMFFFFSLKSGHVKYYNAPPLEIWFFSLPCISFVVIVCLFNNVSELIF